MENKFEGRKRASGFVIVAMLILFIYSVNAQNSNGLGVPTQYPAFPLSVITSPSTTQLFGYSVAAIKDINNNNYNEIVIGSPKSATTVNGSGNVYIKDGQTLNILYTLSGNPSYNCPNAQYGTAVDSLSDITNDGIEEIAVFSSLDGIGPQFNTCMGIIYVYSGANGSLLYTIDPTTVTATVPSSDWPALMNMLVVNDITGDGIKDILASNPGSAFYSNNGFVVIFNGLNGNFVASITSPTNNGKGFGAVLEDAGDLNSDGFSELIIFDADFNNILPPSSTAYVFSGATRSLMYMFTIAGPANAFVIKAAALDWNFDGINDIAIPNGMGQINVYSGVNSLAIASLNVPQVIYSIEGKDINFDGYGDLVILLNKGITISNVNQGTFFYRVKRNFNPTFLWNTEFSFYDLDNDLLDEMIIGMADFYNPGSSKVYLEKIGGVKSYGQGTLQAAWIPSQGSSGVVSVTGATPLSTLYIGISSAPKNTLLPSGDYLLIDETALIGSLMPIQSDVNGAISIPLNLANNNGQITKIYGQIAEDVNGTVYTSNGLEFTKLF